MSIPFRTHLLAVALLTAGPFAHADDKSASSGAYDMVPIQAGGKAYKIPVQKQPDPLRNVSSPPPPSGQYDPSRIYSHTSDLSNKTFSASSFSESKSDMAMEAREKSSFLTKSYGSALPRADQNIPNLDTKYGLPTTVSDFHGATGFDKSYTTSSSDMGKDKPTLFASDTSSYQGRAAEFDTSHSADATKTFASPLADKTFNSGIHDAVRHDLNKINSGDMQMKDLPDRPLTIDEVRALINHGVKPDTTAKPEPASKALNDPDYTPEVSPLEPPPPSEADHSDSVTPRALPVDDDDKNDPVPPPGTMAQPQPPENSEPLPQH